MSGKLYQVQNGQKVDVTPRVAALTDVSSKADISLGNVNSSGAAAMAHAAMPSGQRIALTLPASGGAITVPADGWVACSGISLASGGVIGLASNHVGYGVEATGSGRTIVVSVPVTAGSQISIVYNQVTVDQFYFVYANGAAPQP